jgi:hypothetical protein
MNSIMFNAINGWYTVQYIGRLLIVDGIQKTKLMRCKCTHGTIIINGMRRVDMCIIIMCTVERNHRSILQRVLNDL